MIRHPTGFLGQARYMGGCDWPLLCWHPTCLHLDCRRHCLCDEDGLGKSPGGWRVPAVITLGG